MKALLAVTIIIALVCGSANCCLAGGSGLTWNLKGSPPWGTTYKFDVLMGEKDRWDSASQETPPLQPGKAIQLARKFMKKIPLGEGWSEWRMDHVRLLRGSDSEGHEEWLYVVYFYAGKPKTMRSGPPDMSVPVRMDGTIPEPVISKS
jgi:hypothetical protein